MRFALFRLDVLGTCLVLCGCALYPRQGPDIYSIEPDLCTRQRVVVGDLIVSYKVGSTGKDIWDYHVREGSVFYAGFDESNNIDEWNRRKVVFKNEEKHIRDFIHYSIFGPPDLGLHLVSKTPR